MPTAPKRYSPFGPSRQHPTGFRHRREARPSSTQRGYDRHWSRLRGLFLKHHPLCVRCQQEGRAEPATEVDHITPFQHRDDPLRLSWSNLQALCKRHHSRKTMSDTRAGRTRRHG